MTTDNVTPIRATSNVLPSGYSEDTRPRILAYLASMRPLRGLEGLPDEYFDIGRELVERIADSAVGDAEPTIRLTPEQCAEILRFMGRLEPIEPRTWWENPKDAPSHVVGYQMVLRAIAA